MTVGPTPTGTSITADRKKERSQHLAVLAIVGISVVVLSTLAVEFLGGVAVGALLGALVTAAAFGLYQQWRYARRFAADLAAVRRALDATDRRVAVMAKKVSVQSDTAIPALSKEVTGLSRTIAQWSREIREAEIETGIDALNRYVALGSHDAARQA